MYEQEKNAGIQSTHGALLLFMPVFPQALLALMGGHLMSFSLFSAWHFFS